MAERRRTSLLLPMGIALLLAACGAFVAHRFDEGRRWRNEIASVGSCTAVSEPLQPMWLSRHLGSYAETFQPIVAIRLGSYAYDPKTRRNYEIETGPWLERFARITTLRSLDLQSNGTVSDDDIINFAASRPPALEFLNLNRTDTTDRSLEALAAIPTLKKLHISLTFVTEEGIDRLRIARPDMKIVADPLTRRGLGSLRRRVHVDGNSKTISGFAIPQDMTLIEAERVGRIPNPIWIGFFSPVPDDVLGTLAGHSNIESVAFGVPFSAAYIRKFSKTDSLKKLTVYAVDLNGERLVDALKNLAVYAADPNGKQILDAVCSIGSLEQLLLLSPEPRDQLLKAIRERRPDVIVDVERPDHIGYRFSYRYEPMTSDE